MVTIEASSRFQPLPGKQCFAERVGPLRGRRITVGDLERLPKCRLVAGMKKATASFIQGFRGKIDQVEWR